MVKIELVILIAIFIGLGIVAFGADQVGTSINDSLYSTSKIIADEG